MERASGIPGAVESLHPLEAPIIKDFASRRATEFAEGRACAREALSQVDGELAHQPIGRAPNRAPVWPEGIVGSISHCAGVRAAAVASNSKIRGLGIDIEEVQELDPAVVAQVLVPEEIAELGNASWVVNPAIVAPHIAELIIFSAKESLFKLWSPFTHTWLGYEDAQIHLEMAATLGSPGLDSEIGDQGEILHGTLTVRVLVDHPREFESVEGRWQVSGGYVRTSMWIWT